MNNPLIIWRHSHSTTLFQAAASILLCLLLALSVTTGAIAQSAPQTILVVGDSLSAEYGLPRGTGWVALMQARVQQRAPDTQVINASISGDTSAGGKARLPAALQQHHPSIVIIELGANDALRGLSLDATAANLESMVEMSQAAGAKVLLLGVQVPPNYGRNYTEQFAQMYVRIAQEKNTALVPFFLKGIADVADSEQYFQRDRTHPNQSAHPIILENVWPEFEKMLN
ncbi:arylesterase [Saezia sanguinis]|uniref:arylesterase n=1 Tax=Saezia sanguinis TaxID=1965230 RepID=UPI000F8F2473|nr:arylesterase [Saezia sanguinis]